MYRYKRVRKSQPKKILLKILDWIIDIPGPITAGLLICVLILLGSWNNYDYYRDVNNYDYYRDVNNYDYYRDVNEAIEGLDAISDILEEYELNSLEDSLEDSITISIDDIDLLQCEVEIAKEHLEKVQADYLDRYHSE